MTYDVRQTVFDAIAAGVNRPGDDVAADNAI